MELNNIFEIAARNKYRYNYKGQISTEDLWDLGLVELDSIFKGLKALEKQSQEESLLGVRDKKDVEVETKIAIIRRVVEVKQQEALDRKAAHQRSEQKEKIMAILAEKQDAALHDKSEDELLAMLAAME